MAVEPTPRRRREIGDYITYVLVALLGLLGPYLAHGARDNEIYIFGLSLFAFAAAFLFIDIKRHYDLADHAKESAKAGEPHE
jgi:hypothetical protein